MATRTQIVAIVVMAILLAGGCNKPPKLSAAAADLHHSLVRAAWHYDTPQVVELVDQGADPAALVEGECPALIFDAVRRNQVELVALLLDSGVPVDLRPEPYTNSLDRVVPAGRPLAFAAVEQGSREVLALLIDHGVSVNATDDHGLTLLHLAYAHGQYATVSLLLELGADPAAVTDLGHTCRDFELFHVAWQNSELEVRQVLGNGADPNVAFAPGETVLNDPYIVAHPSLVGMLLAAGADPNVQDADGESPLHHAVWSGETESARLLINAGANTALVDDCGNTPLMMAQQLTGNDPLRQLLASAQVR